MYSSGLATESLEEFSKIYLSVVWLSSMKLPVLLYAQFFLLRNFEAPTGSVVSSSYVFPFIVTSGPPQFIRRKSTTGEIGKMD